MREHAIDMAAAADAILRLHAFSGAMRPRMRIAQLEHLIAGADQRRVSEVLAQEKINDNILRATLLVKEIAGEVNILIHAAGILLALPYVLEPCETVLEVSLGAGTGGRLHDLQTTRRIAEFKFTRWQRRGDSVRKSELFADFVNLAEADAEGRRQLFVAGATKPLASLKSNSKLSSVCKRRPEALTRITHRHGDIFQTVGQYTVACGGRVEIVDLEKILPAYLVQQFEEVGALEDQAGEELP